MRTARVADLPLGAVFGAGGGLAGLAIDGAGGAVLWGILAYFVGQTVRSTIRTVSAGDRA